MKHAPWEGTFLQLFVSQADAPRACRLCHTVFVVLQSRRDVVQQQRGPIGTASQASTRLPVPQQ